MKPDNVLELRNEHITKCDQSIAALKAEIDASTGILSWELIRDAASHITGLCDIVKRVLAAREMSPEACAEMDAAAARAEELVTWLRHLRATTAGPAAGQS